MTTTAAAAGPFPSDTTSSSSSVAAYPVTATTPPTPPPPPPPPSTPAQEHQHQHQHQPPAASDCSHTAAADTPRAMNAPPAASVVVAEGPPPPPPPPPPHPTPSNPIVTDAMPSALSSPPPLLISFAAASRAPPASSPSPLHDSSRPGVGAHISDGACSASHEAGATAPAVDDVGVIADGHTIEPAAEEPMEPEQPEQQLEQEPDQQHQQQPEQPQRAPQPAQRRPRNDQNPAVRSLLAFKLLFTFCIGIPNIALVASGIALFAVVPAAVPSYVCEPSLRINLLIDLAISVALAIAWIYAIALLRERSRPLARAISFAGLSKLSLNLLQLGVVFPRDGSVCKVEDKVVWMVAAFRLCLFFGCAVGVLNSMLADMVGPKPFRQNDPYFVHLFCFVNFIAAVEISRQLIAYDAPYIPPDFTFPPDSSSNATQPSSSSSNPRYCEQTIPSYLYFELVVSISAFVPLVLEAVMRVVGSISKWDLRGNQFAKTKLKSGFLLTILFKLITLIYGASVVSSAPVCSAYDASLLQFARQLLMTQYILLVPAVFIYICFRGAAIQPPTLASPSSPEAIERRKADIERCTRRFEYTGPAATAPAATNPSAGAEEIEMRVLSAAATTLAAPAADEALPSLQDGGGLLVASSNASSTAPPPFSFSLASTAPLPPPASSSSSSSSSSLPPQQQTPTVLAARVPQAEADGSFPPDREHDPSRPPSVRPPSLRSTRSSVRRSRRPPSLAAATAASAVGGEVEEEEEEEDDCPICYVAYVPGVPMLAMQRCGHAFHDACLREWLMRCEEGAMRCPLCMTPAFESGEGVSPA